ncbi:MAG: TonB-dependent receptor [Bacteroidia bacterium]|nr:TonB-dependent receptor [Bacteroidia bacterium]
MRRKFLIFSFLILLFNFSSYSQKYLKGVVYEKEKNGEQTKFTPLPSASVVWKGTTNGTVTDVNGKFKLVKPNIKPLYLIVSYVGYKTDTLRVSESESEINIVLQESNVLSEVEISARKEAEYIDKLSAIKTEVISTAGLQRLACCNLSESFEGSGTVDVSFSDAVTGAKQIQMLGLAGIYSQMMAENVPMIRGLAAPFGLSYVPGTWMESIQVSKGTSSVINGYESITGQINVEFKKPTKSEKLHVNMYGNNEGKGEINIYSAQKISPKLSTMTMLHGEMQALKGDMNKDSFIDLPLSKQFNIYHRWDYEVEGKFCNQYGLKVMYDDRLGGQMNFNPLTDKGSTSSYGVGVTTQRYELIAKHGFFLPKPGTSIGIQTVGSYHKQDSYFGLNEYEGSQKSFYGNIIYQTIIGTSDHKLSLGGSYMYDGYDEHVQVSTLDTNFKVNESVPGAFVQYTYDHNKIWSLIAGFRADYHSTYGTFLTPRIHFKYNLSENSAIRISGGKGYRSPHSIAENVGLLASSRQWVFTEELKAEEAWNYGISYTQDIRLADEKKISLSLDAFRTDFINQVIVDIDSDLRKVILSNLDGQSFSNSFQANITFKVIKQLEFSLIGRYNDVKQTYEKMLMQKPMVSPYKGLITASYSTKHEKWSFDITNQFIGKTKLPATNTNPVEHQMSSTAPAYYILHAQITKRFKHIDIYVGGENLTNFTQMHSIISASDPFGQYFDSSMIWGPIIGRMFYAGLRLKIH